MTVVVAKMEYRSLRGVNYIGYLYYINSFFA
jgi:hypothetical protein